MSTAPRLAAAKRDWGHDETGCTVLHIDMDAFYASLETARHPELRGRAVIIGWIGPRSVVSAANYEARKYGVNSAMPMARARRLCPGGAYVPVDMAYYRMMSRRIFTEVFSQITDQIEQVSVDEGFMDVSGALLRWKSPSAIGSWVRAQVSQRFGITCSVGIAANKLVAKMASTNAKPDGMLLIPKSRHAEFVQMMPLRGIPGIGPSLEQRLNAWGISSVADLAQMDETQLYQATRSKISAHNLFTASHGLDDRPIVPHAPEKSIGAEITFEKDTHDMRQVCELLHHCCNEVTHTLRTRSLVARTVTVKLRFPDLHYATKSRTLERPIDTTTTMYPQAVELLRSMLGMPADADETTALPRDIRLAGASASSLSEKDETPVQLTIEDFLGGPNGGDQMRAPEPNAARANAGHMRRPRPRAEAARTKTDTDAARLPGTAAGQTNGKDSDTPKIDGTTADARDVRTPKAGTARTIARDTHAAEAGAARADASSAPTPGASGTSENHSPAGSHPQGTSRTERLHDAELALDAVRERYGSKVAALGLEHNEWKAKQVANNHHA